MGIRQRKVNASVPALENQLRRFAFADIRLAFILRMTKNNFNVSENSTARVTATFGIKKSNAKKTIQTAFIFICNSLPLEIPILSPMVGRSLGALVG